MGNLNTDAWPGCERPFLEVPPDPQTYGLGRFHKQAE